MLNSRRQEREKLREKDDAEEWIVRFLTSRLDPTGSGMMKGYWDGNTYCILFGPDLQEGMGYFADSQVAAVEKVIKAAVGMKND